MVKVNDFIHIINMSGEPNYNDSYGFVTHIDDAGQIEGTWGGCSLIPGVDEFEVVVRKLKIFPELKKNLYALRSYFYEHEYSNRVERKALWKKYNDLKREHCEVIQKGKALSEEYKRSKIDAPIVDNSRIYWDREKELNEQMKEIKFQIDFISSQIDNFSAEFGKLNNLLESAEVEYGTTLKGFKYKILIVERTPYVEELLDKIKKMDSILINYRRTF